MRGMRDDLTYNFINLCLRNFCRGNKMERTVELRRYRRCRRCRHIGRNKREQRISENGGTVGNTHLVVLNPRLRIKIERVVISLVELIWNEEEVRWILIRDVLRLAAEIAYIISLLNRLGLLT